MSPIHLRASPGDYAPLVLLPGDPNRSEHVSRQLQGARQVNAYRGLLGYTGTYRGVPVSVQTTGMGCPSAAIVIEELIMLGAQTLLRIGTCGGLGKHMRIANLVIATASCPLDTTALHYLGGEPYAPAASWQVTRTAVEVAEAAGLAPHVGLIASTDIFYQPDAKSVQKWASRGVLAFEMEAAVLFTIAARTGRAAGCLLTVSDMLTGDDALTQQAYAGEQDLRRGVDTMVQVALETAYRLAQP